MKRIFRYLTSGNLSNSCTMHPLVPVVKILKKNLVTRKMWKKAGFKVLRDLIEKSVNFGTLASSDIRPLLFFIEMDQ